jgi:uncharacterized protein
LTHFTRPREASCRAAADDYAPGSQEEFITEHYWGYTACGERTSEYRVEHPRWKIWRPIPSN